MSANKDIIKRPVCLPTAFQQAQYVESMLVQCWVSVVDVEPTLDQHRANILCLLVFNFLCL